MQGLKEQSLDRARQLFNQEHQRSKLNKTSSNGGLGKSTSARGSITLRKKWQFERYAFLQKFI